MIFSAVRTGDPSLPANENYVHPGDDITFDDTDMLDFEGIIHSWMMSLVQNEEVHLKMDEKSERFLVNPENKNFIWFNGQLLYPSE